MKRLACLARVLVSAAVVLTAHAAVWAGSEGRGGEQLTTQQQQGKYLVTISNCQTCHTSDGGAPFAGGLGFPTDFGMVYSSNITQDQQTGIGAWSLAEFTAAMRRGVRPDGRQLYPVFPYTAYTRMSDEDLAAIYAYLKTLPQVKAAAKPHEVAFPYNSNALLALWNRLYLEEGPAVADASQSAAWNRGAYLVEGPGHCSMCHTPRNLLGAEQRSLAYTGGVHISKVKSGDYRPWSSTNLTSATAGLAAWSEADLVSYLTTGISKRAISFGPMNEVIMNSTRHLTAADAQAVAIYLKSLPANHQPVDSATAPARLAKGQQLYTAHCGTCHLPTGLGAEGKGGKIGGDLGVPLAGSAVVQAPDPSSLINNILYGPELPARPFDSKRREMKAFALHLSDEDVADLASYVRSAWGNRANAVTAEQVARQR